MPSVRFGLFLLFVMFLSSIVYVIHVNEIGEQAHVKPGTCRCPWDNSPSEEGRMDCQAHCPRDTPWPPPDGAVQDAPSRCLLLFLSHGLVTLNVPCGWQTPRCDLLVLTAVSQAGALAKGRAEAGAGFEGRDKHTQRKALPLIINHLPGPEEAEPARNGGTRR